ncbi:hypothetical protein Tco_1070303 [Tanacetum coccineum]|uniref:Uncharacterized protein n=1 Tax=Tanacetum coccineum TaxID=301880 RepID=A0ABQ5HME7_9ASTR
MHTHHMWITAKLRRGYQLCLDFTRGRRMFVAVGFSLLSVFGEIRRVHLAHLRLGRALWHLAYSQLEFRLEDTETHLEASKAREIRLEARVKALEDRFRPPGERFEEAAASPTSTASPGIVTASLGFPEPSARGSDGDADDGDEGDDGGEGDGGSESKHVLLRGGATISLVIAASIDGDMVNGARTIFLNVYIRSGLLGCNLNGQNDGSRHVLTMEVGMVGVGGVGQPSKGPLQKALSRCLTPVYSLVKLEPRMAWCRCPKLEHSQVQYSVRFVVIMEYLVKISKKARILELKRRHLKIIVLTSYTPYPSRKIRRICACTSQETMKIQSLIRRIQENSIRLRGDGVTGIKRHRRNLSSDGVRNIATTSGRGRLKEDLESSAWQ